MQGIKFNQDGITDILEGRKTQTRRPIKLLGLGQDSISGKWWWESGEVDPYGRELWDGCPDIDFIECYSKYKIGETVFVQEDFVQGASQIFYRALDKNGLDLDVCWITASEMQEHQARTFLKITNIKVERLQDISEEDCISNRYVFVYEFEIIK